MKDWSIVDDMMAGIPVDLRDSKDKPRCVPTFTSQIYVGFRVRYTNKVHSIDEVYAYLHDYCNKIGFCVTVAPTTYIYTWEPASGCVGEEPGCVVGIINYPRFPTESAILRSRAIEIARGLLKLLEQGKVSVVFPDETVMIESEN